MEQIHLYATIEKSLRKIRNEFIHDSVSGKFLFFYGLPSSTRLSDISPEGRRLCIVRELLAAAAAAATATTTAADLWFPPTIFYSDLYIFFFFDIYFIVCVP